MMEQNKISYIQVLVIFSVVTLLRAATAEPPVREYLPPQVGNNNGYQGASTSRQPGRDYLPPSSGGNGNYPSASGSNGNYPSASGGGYPGSGFGGGSGGGDDGPTEPANYEFSYQVKDEQSGNDFGHSESRQSDVAQGRYYVLLPDGRTQIVEYTADQDGYKPQIRYEGEANTAAAGAGAGGYPNGQGGGQGGYPSGGQGGYPSGPSGGQSGYQSGSGSGSFGNSGYRY